MEKSYLNYNGKAISYEKNRPLYSDDALQKITDITNLDNSFVLADIGSGTGRLTKPFIDIVKDIYAVEPNDDMRNQAEVLFSKYKSFHSIKGFAENTEIKDAGINIILCGQSIHWFPTEATLKEFNRILKKDGWIICVWNQFKDEEYSQIDDFIDNDTLQIFSFPMTIETGFDSYLKGVTSAADNPNPGDEKFEDFKNELNSEFNKKAINNLLTINYNTVLVIGKIKKYSSYLNP